MSSHSSRLLTYIENFDGTNWEDWSYSIRSAFCLSHILQIAKGTELHPIVSTILTDTELKATELCLGPGERRRPGTNTIRHQVF